MTNFKLQADGDWEYVTGGIGDVIGIRVSYRRGEVGDIKRERGVYVGIAPFEIVLRTREDGTTFTSRRHVVDLGMPSQTARLFVCEMARKSQKRLDDIAFQLDQFVPSAAALYAAGERKAAVSLLKAELGMQTEVA